ncbi:MAG: membrane-bound lytic murein transglycosylase MltF [Gammaproteobacteria bacterium]|nr:membrane-bound lytic murein transglycosylase MltF [Gammaproteobacteria bacterium]NNJ78631.1 membrane-bound lytic murein transglycosylase MltF [Xanthomonadales bacterium]
MGLPRSPGFHLDRIALLGIAALLFVAYSGNDQPTHLERVLQRGKLTMLTRNGASTFYIGPDGATGPEVELARQFANYLGVGLDISAAPTFGGLADMLESGQGDLIAANLSRTPQREERFNFGPDYQETRMLAIYRRGERRPRSMDDLEGKEVMVIADSSYEEALQAAAHDLPGLEWEARHDVGMEELLLAVSDGAIDATLVDSNIFSLNGRYYPRVAIGFTLPDTIPHAWAFPKGSDRSLGAEAEDFIEQVKADGSLAALQEAFYDTVGRMDRVGMHQFMGQVRRRLPPLVPIFQEIAEAYDLDWRLLAAIGYQESHWDPEATSYTGVRGLMMLTRRTANQLGVTDRLDPRQSIEGGARYLVQLMDRLPDQIDEPDRTWMALAAYNMGMGHLEDVRVLTQQQGGDPDSWEDINQRLKLLTQERHYRETRYGYARGHEAKKYVENIQSYYEVLMWMDTREHPLLIAMH